MFVFNKQSITVTIIAGKCKIANICIKNHIYHTHAFCHAYIMKQEQHITCSMSPLIQDRRQVSIQKVNGMTE